MKSSINWQQYQSLEQIPAQLELNHKKLTNQNLTLGSRLNGVWQRVVAHLESSSEPRVWSSQDQTGRQSWNAYDPFMHQSISQVTEQEMRVWLEERHYGYSSSANQGI